MAYCKIKKDGTPSKKPGRQPLVKFQDPNHVPFDKRALRPQVWKCGPDQYKHEMYIPWLKNKAQAAFRGEEFELTFDDYYDLWKDDWNNRGRKGHNKCLARIDYERGWTMDNVEIIDRYQQILRQAQARKERNAYIKSLGF